MLFYFIDTRQDAKSKKPFAIKNADVAKAWTREYNSGTGPFKPVSEPGKVNIPKQKTLENEAAENPYKGMTKAELIDELEARGIEYKSKATNEQMINLLLADDMA